MQHLIAKSQQKRAESDKGFTLIELLVVVVIIGILVAIAVPVYLNYRKGAMNKSAQSDIRAAISTVEQFYTENGNKYPDTGTMNTEGTALQLSLTGAATGTAVPANVSSGNELAYRLTPATASVATYYVICSWNKDSKKIYVYSGLAGGSVKESSAQASLTACLDAGN
ncbi:prepilin-type N-terminal cleavage/methylation domain-containing protein [Catenuloplanes indicus]|uniref:Type IV pilus assembly protein PilA n=1 Tax=Catenuloplanes indicus TaxID=137267 RepID=A0AAE3W8L9_9ACTN|nr:prepilin-type N-terminal cleavage/methylation domain-containing protein [Catenuloplanes indicus]MDQ0370465.1 type IV pilus assembly protein PilA [Catenuloplanes indicus]